MQTISLLQGMLEKRVHHQATLDSWSYDTSLKLVDIEQLVEHARHCAHRLIEPVHELQCVATLTSRQRQILDLVLAGHSSKNIAADLGISQRTVDNHRAAIMRKIGSTSLPALIRTAIAAA
ncbi:MAG: LuxR C-terminal-related transcriptional regulator [Hyphomicrobiaceae bacterium]